MVGHLFAVGAVGAQPRHHRRGLVLGTRHQDPPAEERLGLIPAQLMTLLGRSSDDHVHRVGGGRSTDLTAAVSPSRFVVSVICSVLPPCRVTTT